jgi:hypothetical protein
MDDVFLGALAVTILLETAVLIVACRCWINPPGPPLRRILFAGVLASSWSLPYLWYLLPRFVSGKGYLPLGELFVVLGEAVIFRFVFELRTVQCVMLSGFCNLVSFIAGMAFMRVLG